MRTIIFLYKKFTDIGGAEEFMINLFDVTHSDISLKVRLVLGKMNQECAQFIEKKYNHLVNSVICLDATGHLDFLIKLNHIFRREKPYHVFVAHGYKEMAILNVLRHNHFTLLFHDMIFFAESGTQRYASVARKYRHEFLSKHQLLQYQEDINEQGVYQRFQSAFELLLNRFCLSRAANICVLSDKSRREKNRLFGINAHSMKAAIRDRDIKYQPAFAKKPYFLSVCRLVPKKRVRETIEAFSNFILDNNEASVDLYIAGCGPEQKALNEYVRRLHIEDKVKFLGFVSDDEKWRLYRHAKLFVCLDDADFDITIYEALSQNTPVVCQVDMEIDAFLIENNVVKKTTLDPNDIAEAIKELLRNQPSTWKSVANHLRRNYTYEAYMQRLITFLE